MPSILRTSSHLPPIPNLPEKLQVEEIFKEDPGTFYLLLFFCPLSILRFTTMSIKFPFEDLFLLPKILLNFRVRNVCDVFAATTPDFLPNATKM